MGLQKRLVLVGFVLGLLAAPFIAVWDAHAATNGPKDTFSILVSPSPLVATVAPGKKTSLELKIRNAGAGDEELKMGLKDFKTEAGGKVSLLDSQPDLVRDWVTFAAPQFIVRSGEWYTQKIELNVPADTAFSYTFAITINRAKELPATPGQAGYQGKVAVFALINIDRPGAVRSYAVERFKSDKRVYEYLPATFSFDLKNTGNSIVQPQGNIFIQRTGSSDPIAILKLNEKNSYLIADSERSLQADWSDGFPVFEKHKAADNAPETTRLVWNWDSAEKFRFGHYVAKMVAVYNDGQRDVPIVAEVDFWVIPWKLMLIGFVTLAVLAVGLWVIFRRFIKLGRYARHYHRGS